MNLEDKGKNTITRKDFIKITSAAGAGILMTTGFFGMESLKKKKRYAIVGVGSRSRMYQEAIEVQYSEYAELVGLCDVNEGRLNLAQDKSLKATGKLTPIYLAEDFERMVEETKPETIIVTTVDGSHHIYIIRSMELGLDVITEKPMTIDEVKTQAIINAQKKTGRNCRVTFNYRYSPPRTQVKELLSSGIIGEVLSVDFHWMLNTYHGADYFRRWHSKKEISGGLMVHKATHHFDLVNWWLSAIPVEVFATGKKEFYTPEMAKRFGLNSYHKRCNDCPERSKCGFEFNLSKSTNLKELYLNNEKYDGYYRDQCVFRPEINIEDTMNVLVKYDNNITMCYSLNAFNSWEGYYIIFNGTKGRLEHRIEEKIYTSGTNTEQGGIKEGGEYTRIIPLRGPAKDIEVWKGTGGHGGGDKVMLDDLFLPHKVQDKFLRAADHRSGAYSILTGIAANKSILEKRQIYIEDIIKDVEYPDYLQMPSRNAPIPMPQKS